MTRFSYQYDFDLGTLNNTPQQQNLSLYDDVFENDIYEFDINGTKNLNLSLNNISDGDDADLYLYEDTNSNGVLDSSDLQITSSRRGGNEDDFINRQVSDGTYFARVQYYSGGSDGRIDYDLDLSATSTWEAPNVIAVEQDLGLLDGFGTGSYSYGSSEIGEERTVYNEVNNNDTVDTYQFTVGSLSWYEISLHGLSSDADIRLIQDSNNNGVVDSGEVIDSSTLGSTNDELMIDSFAPNTTYQLQVYQYSGDTQYELLVDAFDYT